MGQHAALIADITAAQLRSNSSEDVEAALMRLAQEPLALFHFLNARPLLSLLHPDAAGPSARIRSKIAATLGNTAVQSKPETLCQTDAEGLFDKSPNPDDLVRFQPSAEDVAEALDDHQIAVHPHASMTIALVPIVSVAVIATYFIFWLLR